MDANNSCNSNNYKYVVENYHNICYNINQLKSEYSREKDNIRIMAVTKTVPFEIVNTVIEDGISLLGENRVQEFLSKRDFYNKKAEVHFIGKLQTNKVKYIISDVTMIESVDNLKLAAEIDKQASRVGRVMDILLEVNIGNEESKSGINVSDVKELASEISHLKNVRIQGLMSIPPIGADESLYEKLYELFNEMKHNDDGYEMKYLSVGMSNDYPTAVKHGANIVRIGTGLFGNRK